MSSTRPRPTIRQIAQVCGVSAMTVSAVLNNKPGQMSAATRERVLKAVREMGYRPTPARWEAQEREFLTLGVIAGVPGYSLFGPGYYHAIIQGIIVAADQLGHNIALFTNNLLNMDPHRSIRVYCDDRCDGLLVIAPGMHSQLVHALKERGFPFINIGDPGDDESISCIDVDNVAEGFAITEYLLRQGHRRIAYIGGHDDITRASVLRREGYCKALSAYGVPPNDAFIIHHVVTEDMAYAPLREMLQRPLEQRPTAIFVWHDDSVRVVLAVARELDLQIPADLSIIGFNDLIDDPATRSMLTTVRQPYEQISKTALEMLIAQIRGTARPPQRVFPPGELIIRQSVASPRS